MNTYCGAEFGHYAHGKCPGEKPMSDEARGCPECGLYDGHIKTCSSQWNATPDEARGPKYLVQMNDGPDGGLPSTRVYPDEARGPDVYAAARRLSSSISDEALLMMDPAAVAALMGLREVLRAPVVDVDRLYGRPPDEARGPEPICTHPGCGLPERLHGAPPGETPNPTRSTHRFMTDEARGPGTCPHGLTVGHAVGGTTIGAFRGEWCGPAPKFPDDAALPAPVLGGTVEREWEGIGPVLERAPVAGGCVEDAAMPGWCAAHHAWFHPRPATVASADEPPHSGPGLRGCPRCGRVNGHDHDVAGADEAWEALTRTIDEYDGQDHWPTYYYNAVARHRPLIEAAILHDARERENAWKVLHDAKSDVPYNFASQEQRQRIDNAMKILGIKR